MDDAPRRRGTTALLTPDFDTVYQERAMTLGAGVAEPGWAGDVPTDAFLEPAWFDAAGPDETGRGHGEIGPDGGCTSLWRAVIWQAFLDATAFGNDEIPAWAKPKVGESARRGARAWLLSRSKNFDEVCLFAQIDPHAVRARARDLESAGWEMPRPGDGIALDQAV